ncbi:hypothetical protein [Shewanella algae]|uniref:hypothetical protein n=1 Tax=Shewanella algae TaxID=38313 RepID=UPI0031F4E3DC
MYGIQLVSQNGNQFISKQAAPLLYWGYVDVSFTEGEIAKLDYKYQKLFNLPTSAGATIAVRTISVTNPPTPGTNGAYLWPIKRADGWNVAISGENPTFTARVYVFVDASTVPLPEYGIAVYGDPGEVIFHNGRPSMVYKQMFYSDIDNPFTQASTPVPFKPATVVWSPKIESTGQGYWRYYNTAHSVGSGYGVGMTRVFVSAAPYNLKIISRYYYPVLDAGYYEQFPNLGNYPI